MQQHTGVRTVSGYLFQSKGQNSGSQDTRAKVHERKTNSQNQEAERDQTRGGKHNDKCWDADKEI